jgi:hypothetical protein
MLFTVVAVDPFERDGSRKFELGVAEGSLLASGRLAKIGRLARIEGVSSVDFPVTLSKPSMFADSKIRTQEQLRLIASDRSMCWTYCLSP